MKLEVIHRTQFAYAEPVKDSFNEVRLQPTSSDGQACHSFILKVIPSTRLAHFLDFYLNYVHYFEVPESHGSLLIESTSIVTTSVDTRARSETSISLKSLPDCIRLEECYDFLQPSQFVSLGPEIWKLALDASYGMTEVWPVALAIMQFIHCQFQYTPLATNVGTHMTEVIQQRRGVCQDFTHVMIGMCRSLKIPARYVSGYLYNGPAGQLVGAQASHAWCEVYLPGFGWHGLDPTNNCEVDERFVKVAIGRDYSDIVPVKGHYKGPPSKRMNVEVKVRDIT
ncbi:MAG TPA: transglutaminase family protein [Verrucomicrobiae bacterium]